MPLLEFHGRHRFAGGFELDARFETDSPVTALFGPSGSGKTTILHVIAGLFRPQQACVRVAGRTLLDSASRVCLPPERRRLGLVFQDALLFPHLTVEGNLRYGMARGARGTMAGALTRVVEVLEIGPLLARYPQKLSGGEKQRVALGRALLSSPELLLMDEPLASLDDALKDRVLTYLERIVAEWRIPVLYVTHSQAEVCRIAGRVILIDAGRTADAGSPCDMLPSADPSTWTPTPEPVNLFDVDRPAFWLR